LRAENQRMKKFLAEHGINAVPQYIHTGSLKGCWRLYGLEQDGYGHWIHQKWFGNYELQDKLKNLGFTDFDRTPLNDFSGNGGVFSVFVRGHDELLEGK